MNKIEELKRQLEIAEKEKLLSYRQERLNSLKKQYEGKAFATHTYERKNKARIMGAVFVERIFMEGTEIYSIVWRISINRYASIYKYATPTCNYTTYVNKNQLTNDNREDFESALGFGYSMFRKEITKQKFFQLWELITASTKQAELDFYKEAPEIEMELERQGDHSDESKLKKDYSVLGIDVIDLKDYPEMYRLLEYVDLPLLHHNRWIPRIYAKQVFELYIQKLKKERRESYSPRTVAWCDARIKTIIEFLTKI